MATQSKVKTEPPLDERVWEMGQYNSKFFPITSDSVLIYFSYSPFCEPTSNNQILIQQGLNNFAMNQLLYSRQLFESRLRTMFGLEYMVAQEPAPHVVNTEDAIWVINKQTRRKRQGEEDEVLVHAAFYLLGPRIFMAPTLADIMSLRIARLSNIIGGIIPRLDGLQVWTPATGRVNRRPVQKKKIIREGGMHGASSQGATPMPEISGCSSMVGIGRMSTTAKSSESAIEARLLEESVRTQIYYGGEYMNENPIVGRPGAFQLESSGRKGMLSVPALGAAQSSPTGVRPANAGLAPLNTNISAESSTGGKGRDASAKGPKTPGGATKPKRRKSKALGSPMPTPS